jgi:hypothetical protein
MTNSQTVSQGTQAANQVDNAKVVYRQLHPKEVKAILSMVNQFASKADLSKNDAEKLLTQTAVSQED